MLTSDGVPARTVSGDVLLVPATVNIVPTGLALAADLMQSLHHVALSVNRQATRASTLSIRRPLSSRLQHRSDHGARAAPRSGRGFEQPAPPRRNLGPMPSSNGPDGL